MTKRSSNDNDDVLGCFFAIFEIIFAILIMLFTSGSPTEKKIGWGIIGVLALIGMLSRAGTSGEGIFIILGIIVVIIIVVSIICMCSNKPVKEDDPIITSSSALKTTLPKGKYFDSVEEALQKHTVPSGYKKIMIECIQQTDIKECPGLIWKDETMLYVLPLLRNSKIFSWPLTSISVILYERRNNPNIDKEYMEVGQSKIADEFQKVFPKYPYGRKGVYTAKFILPIGLEVTNTSGKVLFQMVSAEFHVVDNITQSSWYEKELKELYQEHILLDNGIISYKQYNKKREKLLIAYREREKNSEKYNLQLKAAKELGLL